MRRFEPFLAFTDADVWRPGIGDPSVMGWLTVLAYFVAAALCFLQVRRSYLRRSQTEFIFWGFLTVALTFLGINKQLDFQTLLTLTGRQLAREQGWYEIRRVVQFLFVAGITLAACAAVVLLRRLVRNKASLRLPLTGFVLLLCFIVVRAASFHHVDQLINFHIGFVRLNWVFELGAIGILIAGVLRQPSVARPTNPRGTANSRFAPAAGRT